MRSAISFAYILAMALCVCAGTRLHAQTQPDSPHCAADDSTRDEAGHPRCCADGSMPNGESMCWCKLQIVHLRDYRNPKYEHEVHVPDGTAEVLGCAAAGDWAISTHPDLVGIGRGFEVSLVHPDTGAGELREIVWSRQPAESEGRFKSSLMTGPNSKRGRAKGFTPQTWRSASRSKPRCRPCLRSI